MSINDIEKHLLHAHVNDENEHWIKSKYHHILKEGNHTYCLVSVVLKNFMEYGHLIGHEKCEDAILHAYTRLAQCLQEDEYIVRIHSCYFNLLIKCPFEESKYHDRAYQFHFAVRDHMEEHYGRVLYLDMGFYPMVKDDVDFYNAQYFANECRFGPQQPYPETSYEIYYLSYKDQKEEFRKFENLVQKALSNGDFKLYLQPKVNVKTGEVTSAEALMRWIDPERGMIPLSSFLPNLEENGYIRDVDLYLFDKACGFIEQWRKQYHKDIRISFNLSNAYFTCQYFEPEYKGVFEKYDIPGRNVCIELLESIILNDVDRLQNIVSAIHDLGFDCALDDFGSGFSSFDILTNINLSELKIDRSLFQNINNEKERNLLKHLVHIAHEFDMVAVAEGIETKDYASYMKSIGCDFIQGYYYYKPMPVEEFEQRFVTNIQQRC